MPPKGGGSGGPPPSSKPVKSLPSREKHKQPDNQAAASGVASSSKKPQKQPGGPEVSVTKPTASSTATSPAHSVAASTSDTKTSRKIARAGTDGWRDPIDPTRPYERKPRHQMPVRGGSKKTVVGRSKKPVPEETVLSVLCEPTRRPVLAFTPAVSPWSSSAVSRTSSPHSEPTVDRRKRPRWFRKTHCDIGEITHTEDKPPRPLSRTVLMLQTGQGGTFSYGPIFVQRNLKGQLEEVLDVKAKKIGSTKVRHLRSYGEDVDWIGTKGCISCIGIYFEITHNRVFCAHLNAWMEERGSNRVLLNGDYEYQDLVHQFKEKMKEHAWDHGWDPEEDVLKNTVRLASPHQAILGYAIQDALWQLFGLPQRPKTEPAHGFLIVPKKRRANGGMIRKFLEARWVREEPEDDEDEEDEDDDARWEWEYDDVPSSFTPVDYTEWNGQFVPDEWTLTANKGWSIQEADGRAGYHRYPDPPDD